MNTIFLLVVDNSKLGLRSLQTKAAVIMNVDGLEKLIFTHIHFIMNIGLESNDKSEQKKADKVYPVAQKICPLRQPWGDDVPITFKLNYF